MKKTLLALLASAFSLSLLAQAIPADPAIEQRIEQLLGGMTLEEKIGQMTQLDCRAIQDRSVSDDYVISEALLDSVIGRYKIGSILNVPNSEAVSRQKWQDLITAIQKKSMKELGIPCIYGVDQMHGTTYTSGGTLFPQGNNMGATFNRSLVREGSRISAYESKAGSIPWIFAPVVDLGREPRWPRMWENFGEDAFLNAEMGVQSVLGFQGDDPNHIGGQHAAACLKHFMGYGVPTSGKDRTPSHITPAEMREKHFAPFLAAVRAGALSVMVNSQSNNGMPLHANYEYLTQWLKEDLQWDGLIVTDWADIENLWKRDHIAATKKEAIRLAINAGIDMSMDPYRWDFCILLRQLVEEGQVPMSRIDDAVRRVLRLKLRLGLFEKPYYDHNDFPLFASQDHAARALDAAEQSIVLLKNQDLTLPLRKDMRLLVTGPNANTLRGLNGGWTMTWQGKHADSHYPHTNTIVRALKQQFGEANVDFVEGVRYDENGPWWKDDVVSIEAAVKAAKRCDVIVACIGENSYAETPGNLDDLALSQHQQDLVKALAKTGKPIVLILNEGRPRLIREIEPLAKAVVHAMLPGNFGGDALAHLLSGDVNFSAKLPFTYPKYPASLTTYDYKPCEQVETMEGAYNYDAAVSVQWAFGYGLSYTTFAYTNLRIDKPEFTANDVLTVSVDITNTGSVAGREPVLLFASDLVASLTPDNRRLRAFDKTRLLQPGETQTIALTLRASDMAFVGYDGRWHLEAGDFRLQAGDQTLTIRCTEDKHFTTPNI